MATIELLKRVSATIADPAMASTIRRRIISKSPPRQMFEPLNYFTQADAMRFLADYETSSAAVARQFLNRSDGVLFREHPPADDDRSSHHIEDGEILNRLLAVLPQMVEPAPVKAKKKIGQTR